MHEKKHPYAHAKVCHAVKKAQTALGCRAENGESATETLWMCSETHACNCRRAQTGPSTRLPASAHGHLCWGQAFVKALPVPSSLRLQDNLLASPPLPAALQTPGNSAQQQTTQGLLGPAAQGWDGCAYLMMPLKPCDWHAGCCACCAAPAAARPSTTCCARSGGPGRSCGPNQHRLARDARAARRARRRQRGSAARRLAVVTVCHRHTTQLVFSGLFSLTLLELRELAVRGSA